MSFAVSDVLGRGRSSVATRDRSIPLCRRTSLVRTGYSRLLDNAQRPIKRSDRANLAIDSTTPGTFSSLGAFWDLQTNSEVRTSAPVTSRVISICTLNDGHSGRGTRQDAAANRAAALEGVPNIAGLSRDEYPSHPRKRGGPGLLGRTRRGRRRSRCSTSICDLPASSRVPLPRDRRADLDELRVGVDRTHARNSHREFAPSSHAAPRAHRTDGRPGGTPRLRHLVIFAK
ncbi:MAG: hypothetical protein QOI41_4450 [Myxococcales bacterium]|nr:hypothetical protein [Myxococcales bacterium]